MMMIESLSPATAIKDSSKSSFFGPSEYALAQRIVELCNALMPQLIKIHQKPTSSGVDPNSNIKCKEVQPIPVASSRKLKNHLRNPIGNTAEWKALKNSQNPLRNPIVNTAEWRTLKDCQNPLRNPVKDIQEWKALKEGST